MRQDDLIPQFTTVGSVIDLIDALNCRLDEIPDAIAAKFPLERQDAVRAEVRQQIEKLMADIDANLLRRLEENRIDPRAN